MNAATQLTLWTVVAGEEPRISSGGYAGAKCKMTLRISAASSYPKRMTHILLFLPLHAPAGKFVCSSGSVFVPLLPFLDRRLVASELWFDLASCSPPSSFGRTGPLADREWHDPAASPSLRRRDASHRLSALFRVGFSIVSICYMMDFPRAIGP